MQDWNYDKKCIQKQRQMLLSEIIELTPAQILYADVEKLKELKNEQDEILKKYNFEIYKNSDEINEKIKEIIFFLKRHSKLVGKVQAIKDLQRGLSILNKNRRKSICSAKNILLQDGIYANKTYACLCDVCKNYSTEVIKNYIKKGIFNNIIFDTKNNKKINTKQLIDKIYSNLKG